MPNAFLDSYTDIYPFEGEYLETPSGRLHYLDEGPKEAPVLLCVHGNPSWSVLYRDVVRSFRGRMRVIVPDHMGCGLSDQPADFGYRLEDHIDNLERLIEELDLQDVSLLVHDWGGPIGVGALLRHPERFKRVAITNTCLYPATRIPWRIDVCRGGLGAMAVEEWNLFAKAAARMAVATPMSARMRKLYVAPYEKPRSARATARFVQDIPMDAEHESFAALSELGAALPRLHQFPTLLLWGMQDWCFTPEYLKEMSQRMPWAEKVELANASHYLFEDDPQGVREALAKFLA